MNSKLRLRSAIESLIDENKELFWFTPSDKKVNIDEDQLVETVLNYGDEKAVKRLIEIMGINHVAHIFEKQTALSNRRRNNYHELVLNFFQLYFSRLARGYTIR